VGLFWLAIFSLSSKNDSKMAFRLFYFLETLALSRIARPGRHFITFSE